MSNPGSYRTNQAFFRFLLDRGLAWIATVAIAVATTFYALERWVSRRAEGLRLLLFSRPMEEPSLRGQ